MRDFYFLWIFCALVILNVHACNIADSLNRINLKIERLVP